jgi:hypothetical protein
MRKAWLLAIGAAVSILSTRARADVPSFRNHAAPLTFLFGNDIDTHQQTFQARDGSLRGFLYVTFTGEVTPEGYPVARHCDAQTPPRQCVVGWVLRGRPGTATFLYQNQDHPVWLTRRTDIPQPGAFAHFHWITSAATDRRPVTDPRCQAAMDSDLVAGAVCPGFFLELVAVSSFAFEHEGQRILVDPGIDIATHVNIVTSVPASP